MPAILLQLLAATLYIALALLGWKGRPRGPALDQTQRSASAIERWLLFFALLLHAASLKGEIFPGDAMRFSFAIALSVMVWLALTLYWVEGFYARLEGLQLIGLPLAVVCVLLPAVMPGEHILANAHSTGFRMHFLMAMLAYSLFTLAAFHALLMAVLEKNLHRGQLPPLLAGLPPLLTMESLLFQLIHVAFVLLTLTIGSGIFFSESLFGKALTLNHKTVFAVISWMIFAALLIGRHMRGWRGRFALRWTLAGFGALLLAYVGTRFVLEVILGRVS
ncbi:MAG: cytochrome c biogenesis protein CcsA [Rhodocyclaceae bacterium]|jgi:ABC-type uncharacterized transport system permease subunit|nr:cytochrome c biogenesis protein CcsA [Rhodocyclaceae bacterium]